jgi:hypothetical protein
VTREPARRCHRDDHRGRIEARDHVARRHQAREGLPQGHRAYFDVLWTELEKLDLGKAADAAHKDSALHSAEISVRRAMRQTQPVLLHALAGHIYLALLDGDKVARRQMKEEFKEAGPQTTPPPPTPPPDEPSLYDTILKSIEKIGITGQEAADYAAQRAATQVRGINDTTLKICRTRSSRASKTSSASMA